MRRFASLVVVVLASCGPIQSGQVADQINAMVGLFLSWESSGLFVSRPLGPMLCSLWPCSNSSSSFLACVCASMCLIRDDVAHHSDLISVETTPAER
jgi:hypothetical protein